MLVYPLSFHAKAMTQTVTKASRLPPVWLMGLTNATFGMYGGFAAVTLPQMLAAEGIPGGRIAAITATVLSPGFWAFLLAPMLDVRFSRRAYALVFTVVAAAAMAFTVAHRGQPALMQAAMILGYTAACLVQSAVGGWVGSLIGKEQDSGLGAWFAVANLGAGGVMMLVAGQLITRLRPMLAGGLLAAFLLIPLLTYLAIPAPPADRRLARDTFRQLFAQIAALARRREVLLALMLFVLPASSFTLTNVLGGIAGDFRASERLVSVLAGVGSAAAGVVGSLLLPPLAKKLPLMPLYLAIGTAGAFFTLLLLLLPHAPWSFAVAITGENLFQALAFATANAISFETIGRGNPVAATQFSVLIAAVNLPITYMGFVDGRAYTAGGVRGSFALDAGVSLAVCLLLAWAVATLGRTRARQPAAAA